MGRRKGSSAFPVARIKKMMQADDDVGKIATVTPVLVAKALECMMEHVLTEAAGVARQRHTRTVTPQHLRVCVDGNDAFDFLRPTLEHVKPLEEGSRRKRGRSPGGAAGAQGGGGGGAGGGSGAVGGGKRGRADGRRRAAAYHATDEVAMEVEGVAPVAAAPVGLAVGVGAVAAVAAVGGLGVGAAAVDDDEEDYDDEEHEGAGGGDGAAAAAKVNEASERVSVHALLS